jgi:hypothetical protein
MTLPPAAELVALVREQGPGVLDQYAPEIDQLADIPAIAGYLGIQPRTIYRERGRKRAGGPRWPEPEPLPGRSKLWKWRTIVVFRAGAPQNGTASWSRPAEAGEPSE